MFFGLTSCLLVDESGLDRVICPVATQTGSYASSSALRVDLIHRRTFRRKLPQNRVKKKATVDRRFEFSDISIYAMSTLVPDALECSGLRDRYG
jgi:hypothetical protein